MIYKGKICTLMVEGCLLKPTASIALESYMFKRAITFIFAQQGGWGRLITKTGPLMGYLNVILAWGGGHLNSNFLKNSNALVVAHVMDFKASV